MSRTQRDWFEWHGSYEEPESVLATRLATVREYLGAAIDDQPPGPISLVSICAGQGRDVTGVLADHPRAGDISGRLVEIDPRNTAFARESLAEIGAQDRFEVVEGDAGLSDAYQGVVPAGVVLACGVFGNIDDTDLERTIGLLPGLCATGGHVLWTRGSREPDKNPTVRRWFAENGFEEVAFGYIHPTMGVGAHRFTGTPASIPAGTRLFEFVGYDALAPSS